MSLRLVLYRVSVAFLAPPRLSHANKTTHGLHPLAAIGRLRRAQLGQHFLLDICKFWLWVAVVAAVPFCWLVYYHFVGFFLFGTYD